MVYRVIYQPVQIGEAEACQEGERGSSYGGSASSSPGIRAGITTSVRPWTRHSGGDRGENQKEKENPKNRRRNSSTTAGRSRSIDQKLRVKARKSLGSAPWGHNDDNTNMTKGEEE